jgi:hypothetical protein
MKSRAGTQSSQFITGCGAGEQYSAGGGVVYRGSKSSFGYFFFFFFFLNPSLLSFEAWPHVGLYICLCYPLAPLLHFNPRAENMCLVPALYYLRNPTVNRTRQRLVQIRRIVAQGVARAGTLSPRIPLHTGHRTHATIVELLIPMELAPEEIPCGVGGGRTGTTRWTGK